MNYIGSKHRLSDFIKEEIITIVGDISSMSFCDMFAGTGAVGKAFKPLVKHLIANDLEYYAYVINQNLIGNTTPIKNKQKLINELNNLELISNGFIYNNYCLGSGSKRLYFSDYNGQKIDTIRSKIAYWYETKEIDDSTYYFLLSSLLLSADKVANTASVYGSFLKNLKHTASLKLELTPQDFHITSNTTKVYNQNSNILIKHIKGDILYLDPPYNQRQYGANYHLLTTIARYDSFEPKGITGVRPFYNRSSYASSRYVEDSFKYLIKHAQFKYIFLSYNNEGLMSAEFIKNVMQEYGDYSLIKKEYKRFHTHKSTNPDQLADTTYEYLHVIIKK